MGKKLLTCIIISMFAMQAIGQTLNSITPNSTIVGVNLTATVTGSGTLFQSSSPPNSIQDTWLQQGANILYSNYSAFPTNDTTFTATYYVSAGATTGAYDLYVSYLDTQFPPNTITLSLPGAVTVNPPAGYIQGKVFNDVNQNGILDAGEQGINGQFVNVSGIGTQTTNVSGDYSFGVANGNYTVSFVSNNNDYVIIYPPNQTSYNVTISNNNASNNFAANYALTSIYPDSAFIGQNNISLTITSKGLFTPSNVVAGNIRLQRSSYPYSIYSTQFTYVDSNTIIAHFGIINNTLYLGVYNLQIYVSGTYAGYHYLRNSFTIVNPPLFINGIVFLDSDSNGVKDPGESGLPNEKIFLSPDSNYALTDVNGNYSLGSVPGAHIISWVQTLPYESIALNNVPSYTTTVSTTTGGFNFGLASNISPYTSIITLSPCWSGCAHPNHFGMAYQNLGSVPFNGYIYFVHDSNMTYTTTNCWGANTPPDSIIGDTLFWNIYNVQPMQSYSLGICFSTPVGGITINYSATIVALNTSGVIAYTATDYGTHVVSCSMDPNEKSVLPAGVNTQHYTLLSDTLIYTVLFQNTGTDTAYTVVIRDTIDNNLDLNTLSVIESSHPEITQVDLQTHVAKFTFNNILLVDSNTNEGASHGYVRYSILPKAGTPSNTIVNNKADIYFDFNKPVTTNETFNTLVTTIPQAIAEIKKSAKQNSKVIPNPFDNNAWLVFDNPEKGNYVLKVYTVTGNLVLEKNVSGNKTLLEKDKLSEGLYIYKLSNDKNGKTLRGKFVID
jgi:uncharacterized repeat protein (TIGR01451 family)